MVDRPAAVDASIEVHSRDLDINKQGEVFPTRRGILLSEPLGGTNYSDDGQKSNKVTETDRGPAVVDFVAASTSTWFEAFHVIPRRFDVGNVLSTQQFTVEVYSAYRDDIHSWDSFVNGAGAGVSLIGQPTLPENFNPQEGLLMTLQVDTSGTPNVDATLDFVFDEHTTEVPITLQRVVLFNLRPEMPYTEELEFFTDVLEHEDGSEQRISLRKNPRQFFDWRIIAEDGAERSYVENIMFDWQRRVFGIPVWHELTRLTVAATGGVTDTLNVQTTDYRDFRVGGLVLIYTGQRLNDVGTISAIGATTITLETEVLSSYPVNTFVVPLRTGVLVRDPRGTRYPVGAHELQVRFRVDNNDANLADTSAWPTYSSKVLLTDHNVIGDSMRETFTQDVTILDNEVGKVFQDSRLRSNKRNSVKTFRADGDQARWEVRQLMHALRGRQISFFIPTFAKDLVPIQDLDSGTSTLVVTNVGYAQFVRERQPRNVIEVKLKDGTSLLRGITGVTEDSSTQESFTLDDTWPATYTPDDVDRISFVEKSRFDDDKIKFEHDIAAQITRISAPVRTVFE